MNGDSFVDIVVGNYREPNELLLGDGEPLARVEPPRVVALRAAVQVVSGLREAQQHLPRVGLLARRALLPLAHVVLRDGDQAPHVRPADAREIRATSAGEPGA